MHQFRWNIPHETIGTWETYLLKTYSYCKKEYDDYYYKQKEENAIKPSHYKAGEFDVIAFCQLHNINFDLGNVIKYVTRAGKKENNSELQDLNKAMEYLKRRIEFIKGE